MPILRIESDRAVRIVAHWLRDGAKMHSREANDLADNIINNLLAAMRKEIKPSLADAMLVPQTPPEIAVQQMADILDQVRKGHDDGPSELSAEIRFRPVVGRIWALVRSYGVPPREDIVRTDK